MICYRNLHFMEGKSLLSSCHRGAKMLMFLLTILLDHILKVEPTEYTDVYNFPMFGTISFENGGSPTRYTTYGSVTIAHRKLVIAVAENLCQLDPNNAQFIFREDLRSRLYVVVGSDLMTPPHDYQSDIIKRVKVDLIYFGKSSKFATFNEAATFNYKKFARDREGVQQPAPSLQGRHLLEMTNQGYVFNPFGELQWDVALLTLDEGLDWGPYILPIPNLIWHKELGRNYFRENYNQAWRYIENVEITPHDFTPCVVPGWSTVGNNEIVYHRVVYVRFKECATAICGAYPGACLHYLNPYHHICFKSLSFADSCVMDQGAPVLCPWAKNFPLGILVKTWECGNEGLPTVFTRVDTISAFAVLIGDDSLSVKEPRLDDARYTESPDVLE